MAKDYLGFYWTLPVNWRNFHSLPANVDDAAKASRTIRYQREVISRYVTEHGGTLAGEIAFIDVQPDRATDMVAEGTGGKGQEVRRLGHLARCPL
jgi:hypothetical protein